MTEKKLRQLMTDLKMFVVAHKSLIRDIDVDFSLPDHEMIFIQGKNGTLVMIPVEDISRDSLNDASVALRS